MSWLRIKLRASERDTDVVADALTLGGALAVSIQSATEAQRLQGARESVPFWDENLVTGLFSPRTNVGDVVRAVRKTLGLDRLPYEADCLGDADWEQSWRAEFRPLRIADSLWVVPSWHEPPDSAATTVVLDPGLAFGTGTHPTTRLCLAWLATQPLAGRAVMDYGCGSGILSIAALKLGAAHAVGVDVDPQALSVSRENARRNGVHDRFGACFPEELGTTETYPIVVANILSGTLIALALELTARLEPRGRLALSGILADQTDEVAGAYAQDFEFEPRRQHDDWVLLTGTRRR